MGLVGLKNPPLPMGFVDLMTPLLPGLVHLLTSLVPMGFVDLMTPPL